MTEQNTTAVSEILESYKAIQVAATERHAMLTEELSALEDVFPSLRSSNVSRVNRSHQRSPEARARQSAHMKARWAATKANGAVHEHSLS